MEPKSPSQSFEQMPTPVEIPQPAGGDRLPQGTPERQGVSPERTQEAQPASTPPAQTQLPTPVQTPAPSVTDDDGAATDDDTPAIAADEDVIEKEWVDKAKKIIESTRNDPHRQEREVGKLQIDYLKKRYGKEIGSS